MKKILFDGKFVVLLYLNIKTKGMMKKSILAVLTLLPLLPIVAQTGKDSTVYKTQRIKDVVVIGNSPQTDNLRLPQMGMATMKAEAINKVPVLLGEPDVLKAIQTQAGVSNGIEGFAGLYVRGGENDENLYLFNGLPLYNVNHLGGLFSSFNVATVDRLKFFKAGFPAQYGGRVSSVTDIKMLESDFEKYHGRVSVGLLSGNVFLTGPIVKDAIAFSVGVRRSWLDLITVPALAIINSKHKDEGEEKMGRYAFTDVNLKLDYNMAEYGNGYVHFYYGNDYLKAGEKNFGTGMSTDYEEENVVRMNWGNIGAATGVTYRPCTLLTIYADAYYSHYSAWFKQNRDDRSGSGDVGSVVYSHKTNKNGTDDIGAAVRAELTPANSLTLRLGAEYTHHRYRPEDIVIESSRQDMPQLQAGGSPSIDANEVAVWEDNMFAPADWLQANVGARLVSYASEGRSHVKIEPRVNVRVSPLRKVSFKAGYSRVNQFVQQICNSYISLPTDSWQPIGGRWEPLESDQVSAGIFGDLPADGMYFSVEGYYKWMRNLLEYREDVNAFTVGTEWSDKLTAGTGTAYGVDISVHKDKGRLTGHVSYGLLWNTRRFDELNGGREFPAKYDNRHKINIGCQYKLKDNVELTAAWTYMTGNRITLALSNYKGMEGSGFTPDIAPTGSLEYKWGLDNYTERNNVRLPAYHRLDVGVSFHYGYRKGREGILDIGLYNAYSRNNPITITKDGKENLDGSGWTTKFRKLGILPVIPSISYTLKF